MDETNKAVPPAPMPQDKGRWRVAPARDGRQCPLPLTKGDASGKALESRRFRIHVR